MRGVVYVDILVLVNAILGYFLLKCTALAAARPQRAVRLCLAALLSGVSALSLLWPNAPGALMLLCKLLAAAAIIAAAFPLDSPRIFAKTLAVYVAANVLLGGVVTLLLSLGTQRLDYRNFAVYLHVSPILLIGCILAMYVLAQGAALVFGRPREAARVQFSLTLAQATLHGMALVDTGQHLRDAMSGEDAALCSFPDLAGQLPAQTALALESYWRDGTLTPPLWLVSVHTATGIQAMPALRADALTLCTPRRQTMQRPVLVFCGERLAEGGCQMLIGTDFMKKR